MTVDFEYNMLDCAQINEYLKSCPCKMIKSGGHQINNSHFNWSLNEVR